MDTNGIEINIRQAKLYDVPAMARIERLSFDEPWSADELTRDVTCSDEGVYVAVAMAGEERAGYADMRIVAGESQIYNIAIAPEFRRLGIGEALVEHMIERSEALGCSMITLEVRAGNDAAMELYKKMGFKEVGRRRGYYGRGSSDAILMDRALGCTEINIQID